MLFLRSLSQRRIQETAATHAMTHMKGTPGACFPCVACHPRERAAIPEKRINSHTHKVSLPTRSLTNKHSQVRERERAREPHSSPPSPPVPPPFQQNPPARSVKRLLPWRRTAGVGGAWRHGRASCGSVSLTQRRSDCSSLFSRRGG